MAFDTVQDFLILEQQTGLIAARLKAFKERGFFGSECQQFREKYGNALLRGCEIESLPASYHGKQVFFMTCAVILSGFSKLNPRAPASPATAR